MIQNQQIFYAELLCSEEKVGARSAHERQVEDPQSPGGQGYYLQMVTLIAIHMHLVLS